MVPVWGGNGHNVGGNALLDDLVVELLGAAPLADAAEAVGVAAGRQDAEAALRRAALLDHQLHADGAHLQHPGDTCPH